MKETATWICDTCGESITAVEHGWVEWLSRYKNGKREGRGLRLVHHVPYSPRKDHGGCQYHGATEYRRDEMTISDCQLREFVGPGGLMDLLAMIAEEELPKDDVLEMIKRLHIPGYEQARGHFASAISDGAFEPNTAEGYYKTSDIRATLQWAQENREE